MRIGTAALLGSALAVMGIASSANAQDAQYAHAAITAGNLSSAERTLERETRAAGHEWLPVASEDDFGEALADPAYR